MVRHYRIDQGPQEDIKEFDMLFADLDDLVKAIVEQYPPDQQPRLVLEANRSAQRHLKTHLAEARRRGDSDYHRKLTAIKPIVRELNRRRRWYTCLFPSSPDDLAATLRWFAENGGSEELLLLDHIDPHTVAADRLIWRLVETATLRGQQRVHSSSPVEIAQAQELAQPWAVDSSPVTFFVFDPLHQGLNRFPFLLPAIIACCETTLGRLMSSVEDDSRRKLIEIRRAAKRWLSKAERLVRRQELRSPSSLEGYEASLWWMAEKGDADDLDLLRHLKVHPAYHSPAIQRLFEMDDVHIHGRVYSSQAVLDREEAAYQQHRQEWDQIYKGEHIAIHRGEVIDHDPDKFRLIERLDQKQWEGGRFRAYIVQIGRPVYVARGPVRGRRPTRTGG